MNKNLAKELREKWDPLICELCKKEITHKDIENENFAAHSLFLIVHAKCTKGA